MSNVVFTPFSKQKPFLMSQKPIVGAFAGKRGGKTEVGAVRGIKLQEEKPNYIHNDIDPYIGLIIAPTTDMLRRLSLKKFMAYGKPFIKDHNKTTNEIVWHDNSQVLGLSADKPQRIEGIKAGWAWLDEVFQMSEQMFLEAMARVSDTEGFVFCTGSLGIQYINPKLHWAYKYFKEKPDEDTECFEWETKDNPHFPRKRLEKLQDTLDPETFRAMFTLTWDTQPKSAVYSDFGDANILKSWTYNPKLPTYVVIDWGWAHEMAIGFFQYDRERDMIVLFDEIVRSRLKLEDAYDLIFAKPYKLTDWGCDIAGDQEREQTGLSNIRWFEDRDKTKGIRFKRRSMGVQYGISVVRSFIKSASGKVRFFIVESCKKSIDGMKQYRYAEKDGIIQNENPVKKDDDAVDMIRYFFVNFLDPKLFNRPQIGVVSR